MPRHWKPSLHGNYQTMFHGSRKCSRKTLGRHNLINLPEDVSFSHPLIHLLWYLNSFLHANTSILGEESLTKVYFGAIEVCKACQSDDLLALTVRELSLIRSDDRISPMRWTDVERKLFKLTVSALGSLSRWYLSNIVQDTPGSLSLILLQDRLRGIPLG